MRTSVTILLLGTALVLAGELSLGTMLALGALAIGFLTPVSQLVATAFELQELGGHVARIDDILQEPVEWDARAAAAAPRLSGHIFLDRVTFAYATSEPPVLSDVSVTIAPRPESGNRRSIRSREVDAGSRPASDCTDPRPGRSSTTVVAIYRSSTCRRFGGRLAWCARARTCLGRRFAATSRWPTRMRVSRPFRRRRVWPKSTTTSARCQCTTTPCSPTAARVFQAASGNASPWPVRSCTSRRSLLLLDEATSELDTVCERRIMSHLAAMQCATHRGRASSEPIVDAEDLILVLDRGAIVESGRHAELLEQGGLYARLASRLSTSASPV